MAKNETTATDIAPTTQVTEAEAANFELDPHLISLMWSEPFSPTPRRPPGRATLKPRPMAQGTPGILRGVSACCVSWARHDLVVFVIGFCTALKSAI